ncbi:MAG: hypothetical protein HN929_03155 [Chloroflexi bacterium]|jgi:flavin-dependent dehydrogenase|nr:hypothetical protein [Chloroflexota bacterium]MBT7080458.1 hypothetical protein [Chloroflexota bacterium]MBT7289161.1 hypothetical protein [Chloroflexota bacterium]
MNINTNKLGNSSKVAVIGGGPAGSFFALYLIHYANKNGIQPEITIYQNRNFDKLGPEGCKGCAGILSPPLLRNLKELNLFIPEQIIQSKVETYAIHNPDISISVTNPDKYSEIFSICRGGGPRISSYENAVSFDNWLLNQAQKRGVSVNTNEVSSITLGDRPKVNVAGADMEYDLVVQATGINAKHITVNGIEYVRPKTLKMSQGELYVGTQQVESWLDKRVHVFLIPKSRVVFGTLVPKGPFINVSVLSNNKQTVSITDFLNYETVRNIIPEHYERTCACKPKISVGLAHNYYADGYIAVGDSVVSRLYKDGIGSALLTSRQAAYTAVRHGLSAKDFKHHYQPFCDSINSDNMFGRALFSINDYVKNSRVFLSTQKRLVKREQNNKATKKHATKAAMGMFAGSYSYKEINKLILLGWLSPRGITSLIKSVFATLRHSLYSLIRK